MTRDEFATRYELLEQLSSEGVRSFVARERGPERTVIVHFLDGSDATESQRLLWMLGRLPAEDHRKVIENTLVDRKRVIVTEPIPGFTSLREWLESRVNYVVMTPAFRGGRPAPQPTKSQPTESPSTAPASSREEPDDSATVASIGAPLEPVVAAAPESAVASDGVAVASDGVAVASDGVAGEAGAATPVEPLADAGADAPAERPASSVPPVDAAPRQADEFAAAPRVEPAPSRGPHEGTARPEPRSIETPTVEARTVQPRTVEPRRGDAAPAMPATPSGRSEPTSGPSYDPESSSNMGLLVALAVLAVTAIALLLFIGSR